MAADNAIFDPCFSRWIGRVLSSAREYYQSYLKSVPDMARFGINVEGLHERHKIFNRALLYVVMCYWRAWDYNTWYATETDGCMNYLPLGSFVTDETVACLLREADCHQLDLRPLLRLAGIRPLPDGIGIMQIQGTTGCNSIVFQVGRARRTDAPPSTDINYTL